MPNMHGGSELSLKGIPVSLDENTYTYLTFDENLVSGANKLAPVGLPDYVKEIYAPGRFYDGVIIKDNSNIYLKYDLKKEINVISFWFKSENPTKTIALGSTPRILLCQHINESDLSLGYWMCYIGRTGESYITANKLSLEVHTNSASYKCSVNSVDPLDGEWHFVSIELNRQSDIVSGYSGRLSIDGNFAETELTLGSKLGYSIPIRPKGFFRIGHWDETEPAAMAECSIDEICLRNGNYNEEQITRWFLSNSQFYDPYNYIEPSDSDKKPNVSLLRDMLEKTWDDVDEITWDQVDDITWNELRYK